MPAPLIAAVGDEAQMRNWREVDRAFRAMTPAADAVLGPLVTLAAGDNNVSLPRGLRPLGRITVFLSASVTLFDKGQTGESWVVNSSGAATARFLFF